MVSWNSSSEHESHLTENKGPENVVYHDIKLPIY